MGVNDPEIQLLLSIVKGNNIAGSLPGFDITRLIRLSNRHKVTYQVYVFAQKHPEIFTDENLRNLNERNHKVARQSLMQLQELKKIAGNLADHAIPFVCIKGPQLSRMLYGREALKESVDLDIMLAEEEYHLPEVDRLLQQLGYTETNLNDYPGTWRRKLFLIAKREVHYFNRKIRCAIDLHIRPGANTYLTARYFSGFMKELKSFDLEGTPVPVLQDEKYFVYLCYHGSLHQFMRLAWLLDIRAFLQQKKESLDFRKISEIAKTLNVSRCVHLTLLLLKQYFEEDYGTVPELAFQSKRLELLAKRCKSSLVSKPDYPLSLKGRIDKVVYIMMLLKGLPAKIDWLYGILMRQVIKIPGKTQNG